MRLTLTRPLLAGHHDALDELLALERLAPAVFLDDHERHALDILVRREAPLALQALAPPPDARTVLRSARVDDAVIPISAVWASHGRPGYLLEDPDFDLRFPKKVFRHLVRIVAADHDLFDAGVDEHLRADDARLSRRVYRRVLH